MIDRQFERIGVYSSTVDKEWVEYMRPQENGNKTDVRWVKLTNAQGVGLMAVGAPPLNVTARHYTKDDLERAGVHVPDEAPSGDLPQSGLERDGRRRHR